MGVNAGKLHGVPAVRPHPKIWNKDQKMEEEEYEARLRCRQRDDKHSDVNMAAITRTFHSA